MCSFIDSPFICSIIHFFYVLSDDGWKKRPTCVWINSECACVYACVLFMCIQNYFQIIQKGQVIDGTIYYKHRPFLSSWVLLISLALSQWSKLRRLQRRQRWQSNNWFELEMVKKMKLTNLNDNAYIYLSINTNRHTHTRIHARGIHSYVTHRSCLYTHTYIFDGMDTHMRHINQSIRYCCIFYTESFMWTVCTHTHARTEIKGKLCGKSSTLVCTYIHTHTN